jgi:hypothetical protein
MNALLNQHLLADTVIDSAALGVHGCIVHQMAEPGSYAGTVYLGPKQLAGRFRLMVEDEGPSQADIDLASFGPAKVAERQERFVVAKGGYVVFHVSWGRAGYSVRLVPAERETKARPFDSRVLGEGDVFAVTLIRPGAYRVTNDETGARGKIIVSYPPIRATPYEPPKPVSIECRGKALRPSEIKLNATQGQVYRCNGPAHVRIELTKPDDGPRIPGPQRKRPSASERPRRA